MLIRNAYAVWEGDLREGKGRTGVESGVCEGQFSFGSRFETEAGTNPEELLGASLAGCFSMHLAGILAQAGFDPQRIRTNARVNLVHVGTGYKIGDILLETEAEVPGISREEFIIHSEDSRSNCPVSQALKGVEIKVQSKLVETIQL